MRGRRPKPTVLRVIEGNRGKRPLPQHEPRPTGAMPRPPKQLSKAARAHWRQLAPHLHRVGLLTSIDGDAFGVYCTLWADVLEAQEHLDRDGIFITAPAKTITRTVYGKEVNEVLEARTMPSPWLGIRNRSIDLLLRLTVEFGLTPASRSRISVLPHVPGGDDLGSKYFGD
jgi:P27 family predicted phage terminase small subunit